ncbi:unnamed protein product [Moneuplotes crassus]|uniref:non-specific serine/threonine protein kinase n=1 Tax=Euplotes crassus TaxID=5936 RepID=A0AAD1YA17_EUPCR|nr:unnamed protein product [Moneuplotes crassus]
MEQFEIIEKLGEGAYSEVYKVLRITDNIVYALKKCKFKIESLNKKEIMNSLNEVRILASIDHKNVISYKEAFYDKESLSLCIIMEYANDKDLYQ